MDINSLDGLRGIWRSIHGGVRTLRMRLIIRNTLVPSRWYHVACTYDGTAFNIYVNGVVSDQLDGVDRTQWRLDSSSIVLYR